MSVLVASHIQYVESLCTAATLPPSSAERAFTIDSLSTSSWKFLPGTIVASVNINADHDKMNTFPYSPLHVYRLWDTVSNGDCAVG